jgi:hypothetical protein
MVGLYGVEVHNKMDIIETTLTHRVLGYVQEKNVVLWQLEARCMGHRVQGHP